MKKLTVILALISLFAFQSKAGKPSKLSLRMHNNTYFCVTIDNVFYKNTTNNYISNSITEGNHKLKVTQKTQAMGNHQNTNVVFDGTIFIPGGYDIEAIINKNSKFEIVKKTALYSNNQGGNGGNNNNQNGGWGNNNNNHNGNQNGGWGNNNNNQNGNQNGGWGNNNNQNNNWDKDDNSHHDSHHHNGNNNNNQPVNNYSLAMNADDFHQLKMSVSSKSFENTKLEVAKQATAANWLMCDQVLEIMKLFSFESTKLDYAKFAYDRTLDKEKYYKVNDAFTFESSITSLNQYIKGHK
ncbi:MAG: DUF4476 domain-containing protein [Bacteroidota bacterium]